LILAAKYGRGDIVAKLLARRANPIVRDSFDRSALFYAARAGDLASVKALIAAKSPINDGSLHEAARNLHSEVVELLRKCGHNPNFRSCNEQHGGRTALQELALMSYTTGNGRVNLEETIRSLIRGKIEVKWLDRTDGKNALFLALDNIDDPYVVCRALLDVGMWEQINHPDNVFVDTDPETGVKHFFSPTTYLEFKLCQNFQSDQEALLRLLRQKGCEDRFFAERGVPQPYGAIGMPKEIAKEEQARKDREKQQWEQEEDHQMRLFRQGEQEKGRREREQLHHDQRMLHEKQVAEQKHYQEELSHQQQRIHEAEKAAEKQERMVQLHNVKQSLEHQVQESQAQWARTKAQFEELRKKRLAQLNMEKIQGEQDLKEHHSRRMEEQKVQSQQRQQLLRQRAFQSKMQNEKKIQAARAAGDKQRLQFKKAQDNQALRSQQARNNKSQQLINAKRAQEREKHRLEMERLYARRK
jgi:hypothetical protein